MKQYRIIYAVGKKPSEIEQEMNEAAMSGYVWEGKEMTCVRQARNSHYQSGAAAETWSVVMEKEFPEDATT